MQLCCWYAASKNLNGYWNPLKPELEHLFSLPTFFHNAMTVCSFFPFDIYLSKVLAADSLEFPPRRKMANLTSIVRDLFSAFSLFSLLKK